MDKLNIETSQNVSIEYEVASLGDRIIATIIDWLILFGYYIAVLIVLGLMTKVVGYSYGFVIMIIIILIPMLFYPLLCETFMNGQSFGKRARKIKVIRVDGRQPSFGNYLIRWLIGLVEVNFYGLIAIITIVLNGKGQRLGDLASGTAVIKLRNKETISSTAFENVTETYKPQFPQAAMLADEEATTIKQAIQLGDNVANEAIRSKLANKLKDYLKIESAMDDKTFLRTLLNDFNKINGKL